MRPFFRHRQDIMTDLMSEKHLSNFQLYAIFESGETSNPLDEVVLLTSQICPEVDLQILYTAHRDVTDIFSGEYPGFKASIAKYHNLRHTYSVVLATVRLFHGLYHEQKKVSDELVLQGLLSAYFHDLGMLPQSSAEVLDATDYTRHHEQRSIAILESYVKKNKLSLEYIENCATIIHYTNLDWQEELCSRTNSELELCGQIVGSADLLAQMADRYYLESLPFLFQEHKESGIDKHSSALDLMRGTIEFHEKIIKKRLEETLGNLAPSMKTHFSQRWNIDKNLYLENINLNLEYLKMITEDCSLDLSCWGKYLRRTPPTIL